MLKEGDVIFNYRYVPVKTHMGRFVLHYTRASVWNYIGTMGGKSFGYDQYLSFSCNTW